MTGQSPIYGDAQVVWQGGHYELIKLNTTDFVLPQWLDAIDMFSEFSKEEWDYVYYNRADGSVDLRFKRVEPTLYRVCGGNWDSDCVEVEIANEDAMVKLLPQLVELLLP